VTGLVLYMGTVYLHISNHPVVTDTVTVTHNTQYISAIMNLQCSTDCNTIRETVVHRYACSKWNWNDENKTEAVIIHTEPAELYGTYLSAMQRFPRGVTHQQREGEANTKVCLHVLCKLKTSHDSWEILTVNIAQLLKGMELI